MEEDTAGVVMEESDVDEPSVRPTTRTETDTTSRYSNGQCVMSVPSSSLLSPRFDLSICRALLERDGFQIPVSDFETPLQIALDVPAVRRYLFFNSSLFHFVMAPIVYLVIWCAVYSSLHPYISFTDFWVLCLSVTLLSIFITTAIILVLHHSNKEINVNMDVRLIQVNERMSCHKLLVGVADWVHNCTGTLQLSCVYWDSPGCLRSLTETLEELRLGGQNEAQKKLRTKMAHLVLVTEVMNLDSDAAGSEGEEGSDEESPLLVESGRSTPASLREDTKITTNYSLVPESTLPAEAAARQLLLTYSAVYVRLLISENLPVQRHLRTRRTHCTTASLCLCQYVQTRVLRC